jgi:hypothetical protein
VRRATPLSEQSWKRSNRQNSSKSPCVPKEQRTRPRKKRKRLGRRACASIRTAIVARSEPRMWRRRPNSSARSGMIAAVTVAVTLAGIVAVTGAV